MKKTSVLLFLGLLVWTGNAPRADEETPVSGDAVLRGRAGPSEIVLTTTSRVAGAIHSLTWNGREFIDSYDHGRQLQSASNLDLGRTFIPEVFNPTEAGSRADGTGAKSSSRLLRLSLAGGELTTLTRMAFWLAPGEKSEGHPAYNNRVLSEHLLAKRVRIGYKGLPHAIDYRVTFTIPKGEHHTFAQFEAVTGYMPPEFSRFWRYDAVAEKLRPLDDGPGEQGAPVVLATPTGSHAMGLLTGATFARVRGGGLWAIPLRGREGGEVELRLPGAGAEGDRGGGVFVPQLRDGGQPGRCRGDPEGVAPGVSPSLILHGVVGSLLVPGSVGATRAGSLVSPAGSGSGASVT
jgi:hypothetical protein